MQFSAFRNAFTVALALLSAVPAWAAEMRFAITDEKPDGYRGTVTIANPADRKITGWTLEFGFDRAIERAWGARMTALGNNRYRFEPDNFTREIAPGGTIQFTIAGPPGQPPAEPEKVSLDATTAPAAGATIAAPKPPVEETTRTPRPELKPAAPEPPQPKASAPPDQPRPAAPPSRAAPARTAKNGGVPHTTGFRVRSMWDTGYTADIVVINESDRSLKPWRFEFTLDAPIAEMWEAQFTKLGENRYAVTPPKDYNQEIAPGGFVTFGFKTAGPYRSAPKDTRLTGGGE